MKWIYKRIVILSILSTLIILIELLFNSFINKFGEMITIMFAVIPIFLISILIDFVKDKYQPEVLNILREIHNSCARDQLDITYIGGFLQETDEISLSKGDEVKVLTNSLESYDSTPPSLKVIAKNLYENVKYIYYVSPTEYPTLLDQKDEFIRLLLKENSNLDHNDINSNLIFYIINEPCLYNFSIVKNKGSTKGYWYVTTSQSESLNLTILTLNRDNTDKLIKVFNHLTTNRKVMAIGK